MYNYDRKDVEPFLQNSTKYLKQLGTSGLKGYILLLGFFGTIPFLADLIDDADTVKIALAMIFIPITITMIFWALYLIFTFEKHKRACILFMGICHISLSLIFLGISIKFNYIAYHEQLSPVFIVLTTAGYLIFMSFVVLATTKNIRNNTYLKIKNISHLALGTGSSLGVFLLSKQIAEMADKSLDYDTNMVLISICMLFLSYVFMIGCVYILAYRLLKHFDINIP